MGAESSPISLRISHLVIGGTTGDKARAIEAESATLQVRNCTLREFNQGFLGTTVSAAVIHVDDADHDVTDTLIEDCHGNFRGGD